MKFKALYSVPLALSLILVVSACGDQNNTSTSTQKPTTTSSNQNESASNQKVALTMWYWNGAISDSTIEAAKKKFPNIDLQAQKLPSGGDYATKLKTTISGGGSGPDIVAMDSWISSMLPYKEKFVNLYDQGAKDIQPQYLDWKWKMASSADNKYLIGLPIDVAPVVMYYRKDLFEKAGVPSTPEAIKSQVKTWGDYFNLQQKVKDATGSQLLSIVDVFRNIIGQNSQGYFTEDGKYIGDQAHIKGAWDMAVKAYQSGLTYPNVSDAEKNAAMNNSKVSSFIGASWAVGDLIGAAPDTKGKWEIAYPPGGVGNQGGSFFGLLKTTKNPKEAYEVIKFLTSPDNLVAGYKEFGNYPSTPEVYTKPEMVNKNEFFGNQDLSPIFADAAKDVKIAPVDARDDMVGTSLTDEIGLIDTQKKDPEKAWKDAQEKIKRQLSR
ncbi:ABC transporter substrate-binding protein [Paenibacillus andongensis]|uniref:ABC transporter substrate-binding protein n=1 Tax=Paenibacillus andongensis TaxID=2975482 RepID=UPI0021BAD0D4|nr:extracellular solute-binding protein [Paenibacillus andongensis]